MREFIRHPSDIPIKYSIAEAGVREKDSLQNISQGGLCFHADVSMDPGSEIHINIPIRQPGFETTGIVMWCQKTNAHYDVGVKFKDTSDDFNIRMVEQVCHIEHYKKEVLFREGRKLSGEEAAAEWIEKFAGDFPR